MEFFDKAKAVRFRSHLGKFLVADEDEETVRQSRDGSSQRTRWTVEFVQGDNHLIRLKSIYNKYLTASNEPFLLGMMGKKVLQTIPSSKNDSSVEWEPITDRCQVKLRTRCYGKYLRANGGTPPWRNSVTHDVPHRTATQDWVLWGVDVVEVLEFDSSSDFIKSTIGSTVLSFLSTFASDSDKGSPNFDHAFGRDQSGMEILRKANAVRLRSHLDKYLLADDDQENVLQDRDGTIKNARWTVEIVERRDLIRLKSCFGKYLTASNMPFLLGMTGRKVLQTLPVRSDSSLEWEPIRDGVHVKFRTHYGQYLRANGGLPPWRNHITHDVPHRTATHDWILWNVDIVEFNRNCLGNSTKAPPPPKAPVLPPPPPPPEIVIPQPSDGEASDPGSPTKFWLSGHAKSESEGSSVAFKGRVVTYEVADDNGDVNKAIGERTFCFKGSGVDKLKQNLMQESGLNEEICICSRNPLNGQLYPLRLHLPPNNAALHVVLVPQSSKAARDLEDH